MGEWPSQPVMYFHGRVLPEAGWPVGYAALIERYGLKLPLPPQLSAIAERHHPKSTEAWLMQSPRHQPEPTLAGQLTYALRYEGVDLAVLWQLFKIIDARELSATVQAKPTGSFSRRIWFLFEWLTDRRLDIPDPGKVRFTPVLDNRLQFALAVGNPSARHKVTNNLPGTPGFCPLVRRTTPIAAFEAKVLAQRAREMIGRTRPDLVARAAAFMLLSDSKSSFAIEGERPSGSRTARWGQAIAQAGSRDLSTAELERLQRIVIGDDRFVRLGLRQEEGFVGTHDRDSNAPLPDHIDARHEDLPELMEALIQFAQRSMAGRLDPVVAAASLAFGFVYIHPYVDGNGRLHRWLIHQALAAAHFNPPGLIFPISAAILRHIDRYRAILESYSRPLLPFINWQATKDGNIEVLNDTAPYYRYFDATAHSEFLYECVEQTIEHDLPTEVSFLEAFDNFSRNVQEIIDMPTAKIELLQKFLAQGNGVLSQRARNKEFLVFTDAEVQSVERAYVDAFGHLDEEPPT